VQRIPDHKGAWYDILLHANRVETLEAWVSQLIKGEVIVTDSDSHPYVFAHTEQLEQTTASHSPEPGAAQVISLDARGVSCPEKVGVWTAYPPPQGCWPGFFADLVIACDLVLAG